MFMIYSMHLNPIFTRNARKPPDHGGWREQFRRTTGPGARCSGSQPPVFTILVTTTATAATAVYDNGAAATIYTSTRYTQWNAYNRVSRFVIYLSISNQMIFYFKYLDLNNADLSQLTLMSLLQQQQSNTLSGRIKKLTLKVRLG